MSERRASVKSHLITTKTFIFYDIVSDLPPLKIVDVGALPIQGVPEPYEKLLTRGYATFIGFEAGAAGCKALTEKHGPPHRFLPFIIGDGTNAVFHRNKEVMTSSLFKPNMNLISYFAGLENLVAPESSQPVQTYTLDDVIDWDELDFLQMDIQGGELSVLEGCGRLLPNTLVVQAEVEFVEIYHDQPLFADIDQHLRKAGFQFHTFLGFGQRPYKTGGAIEGSITKTRQVLWSDAVYVPDATTLSDQSTERLLKLAAILHDIYTSVDLVLHILAIVAGRGSPDPQERFVKALIASQS